MAQYGGEQYRNTEESHQQGEGYAHNPLHSTATATGYNIGGTGTQIHSTTAGQETRKGDEGHGYEEGKHGGAGGILQRSGSGSSSSSEDDGEGGRRKKKGVMDKIKEKLPGGDHGGAEQKTSVTTTTTAGGGGYGYEGEEGHEKKGLMDKIKEKLPGSH